MSVRSAALIVVLILSASLPHSTRAQDNEPAERGVYMPIRDAVMVSADGTTQRGEKWALVIGCDAYDPEGIGALKVAVADARRMRDTLVQRSGFAPDHVVLMTDSGLESILGLDPTKRPTYTMLRGQIARFLQSHQASDTLVLYFAGHGFHSLADGRDYLAPLDAETADLQHTALPVDELLEQLQQSGARQALLITDACRKGVGRAVGTWQDSAGDECRRAAQARGIWYLSSCSSGQTSQEDPGLGGGVFTYYLAEGLTGAADGAAGGRADGYVTVTEAQAYTAAKVEAWSRARGSALQTPCRSELDVTGGEMVLATVEPVTGWEAVAYYPLDVAHAGVLALGNSLWVIGGMTASGHYGQVFYDAVHVLDPAGQTWQQCAPLPSLGRAYIATAAYEGLIYAVGGLRQQGDDVTFFSNVDVYDPATNQWRSGPPLPMPCAGDGAAVLDGELWIMGLRSAGSAVSDRVLILDLRAGTWREGPRLPAPRIGGAPAVAGNRLWYVGGSSNSVYDGAMLYYDAARGWQSAPQAAPAPRGTFGLASDGARLYIVGGGRYGEWTDRVDVFDTLTGRWSALTALPTRRDINGSAIVGSCLYSVGGQTGFYCVDNRVYRLPLKDSPH